MNGSNAGDNLSSSAGSTIFTGYGGPDSIVAGGSGNVVYGGPGRDRITISGSGNWIDAGAGSDRIYENGSENAIVLNATGEGTDQMYGSVLVNGDKFDLRTALSDTSWQRDLSRLPDYITGASTNGGVDTVISIVPQGAGGASSALAVLHGVGAITADAFLSYAITN
jgi:hypothetical protein